MLLHTFLMISLLFFTAFIKAMDSGRCTPPQPILLIKQSMDRPINILTICKYVKALIKSGEIKIQGNANEFDITYELLNKMGSNQLRLLHRSQEGESQEPVYKPVPRSKSFPDLFAQKNKSQIRALILDLLQGLTSVEPKENIRTISSSRQKDKLASSHSELYDDNSCLDSVNSSTSSSFDEDTEKESSCTSAPYLASCERSLETGQDRIGSEPSSETDYGNDGDIFYMEDIPSRKKEKL